MKSVVLLISILLFSSCLTSALESQMDGKISNEDANNVAGANMWESMAGNAAATVDHLSKVLGLSGETESVDTIDSQECIEYKSCLQHCAAGLESNTMECNSNCGSIACLSSKTEKNSLTGALNDPSGRVKAAQDLVEKLKMVGNPAMDMLLKIRDMGKAETGPFSEHIKATNQKK